MKHLTLCQRYKIEALLALNFNNSQIAGQVQVHRATIGRELKRNCFKPDFYDAALAQKLYVASKQLAGSSPKKSIDEIHQEIKKRLELQFSPEQICGQLELEQKPRLSHTSIYKHIWKDKKNGGLLFKNLRQSGKKKRKKYGSKRIAGELLKTGPALSKGLKSLINSRGLATGKPIPLLVKITKASWFLSQKEDPCFSF